MHYVLLTTYVNCFKKASRVAISDAAAVLYQTLQFLYTVGSQHQRDLRNCLWYLVTKAELLELGLYFSPEPDGM